MLAAETFLDTTGRPSFMNQSYRRTACLLGLPFDVLDLDQAAERMQAMPAGAGAILSTPNVNWVMLAQDHAWLRDSVLRSRLSVVDGTLLVWLGRATGVAFTERVSGSDLFVRLGRMARQTRVFFFGGMADVAERASRALVPERGSLLGVGGLNPGSGNVEAMSAPALIEQVRAAQPDLVVVALGALRGQDWVVRNHQALGATWVTHLGAVVNFAAGEIKRAPPWVGRAGLEWVWRIVEEPKLWKRYGMDGLRLLGMLTRRVLPLMFWQRWHAPGPRSGAPVFASQADGRAALAGVWSGEDAARRLHQGLAELAQAGDTAVRELDLSRVEYLCPACVGQLLVWHGQLLEAGSALRLVRTSVPARRLLHGFGAEYLLG